MAKEEKKIDKLTEKELIDYVNSAYTQGKTNLKEIAEELGSNQSTLCSKLKKYGYSYKSGAYIKIAEESKKNVEELDLLYIATSSFSTQLSARVNGDTKKEFEELCAEKYPNVAIAKLVSLALKEFVENHK